MKGDRIREKEYLKYVVATLDKEGKVLYLHSLHGGKYMLVEEIEYATKLKGKETATVFYQFAKQDFGIDVDLVLLPVIISYDLIKQVDD